jgi:hypothetical protein
MLIPDGGPAAERPYRRLRVQAEPRRDRPDGSDHDRGGSDTYSLRRLGADLSQGPNPVVLHHPEVDWIGEFH